MPVVSPTHVQHNAFFQQVQSQCSSIHSQAALCSPASGKETESTASILNVWVMGTSSGSRGGLGWLSCRFFRSQRGKPRRPESNIRTPAMMKQPSTVPVVSCSRPENQHVSTNLSLNQSVDQPVKQASNVFDVHNYKQRKLFITFPVTSSSHLDN